MSPVNIRDQFDFINNTAYLGINTGSTSSTQALLYVLGGADANPSIDSINILNNNLVAYPSVPGGIPAAFRIMTFNVAAAINAANSNNNNFYFEEVGNPLIRLGSPATDYQTVAAWDSLRNRDSLSLSVNPFFVSPSLGIPTVDTLDNKGTPTYVTTDLNGSPRSATTPDIGAYEFDVLPVELALTNLVAPVSGCGISDSSIVRVQVGNLGTDTLRNVELSLYMNGQWLETKLFTNTILPGLNAVLSFDTVLDLSLGGRYAFSIYPALRVDANPANDTLNVLVVNQLINNFPFVENFDAYQNGIPAFENGWTSSSANYRWFVNNGRTTTNGTGPAFDATTGSPSGRYLYVESSNGIFAQEATVTSSCLDLSGLTQPMLEFYYHGHGVDCYQLIVEQQVAANWVPIDTLEGPTHQFSRQAWLRHRLALNPAATALRFRALRGTAFEGDWAIDDIRIAAWPSADARVAAVRTVVSSCDSTGSLPVTLELRNEGTTALAQVPVGLRVGNGTPISALLNRSLAPGASDTFQISVPFGAGNNQLRAYTSVPNDGDFRIDTVSTSVFLSGTVAQFPYIDNFETASNWHAGGINSSWQRATPAATVINSAFNGSNSWVTNPIGFVNAEERSWLESPCFNFSQLLQPVLSFALWYNTPATAGANMQYSTNNGQSWQVLGSTVSGANWYTNDSILISGGQPVWSGIINNPSGWRQVQLPLGFLAGQSSVKFRFQLFSPANAILGEGIAIDSFRIAEISASLPTNVQITPPSCSPVSHTVTAGFTNMAGLQSAEVVYRVDASGTTQSVPMTQAAGVWSAVIPPAQAGERVTWYIRSTAANVYNAPAQMYVDGFVSPDIQAGTGVPGDSITVDSRLAVGDSMFVGTNPVQNVQGAVFVLQANRHLSLNKIRLALNRTTDLQLYFVAGTASAGGVQNALYVPLGSFNQVVPGNDSFAEVVLPTPLQMQAGQSGWLYISSSHANALPVEVHSGQLLVSGTDLNVLSGFESISSFQFGGSRVIPRLRLFTSNPVQQVEWLTAGTSPTVLGTGSSLRVRVGTSPVSYQVRFTRLSCLITDTFTVVPTGIRDMAVTRIVSPTQWSQVQNDPVNVQVILKNMGTLASNATQLRIFANGVLVQTAQLNNLFEPGDTLLASVNGVNVQAQGSGLQLCAGSGLGDDVPANDSICLFIPSTTNVWEQQNGRLQLYPNPANEQVLLSWDQPLTATTQLAVRDGLGRVVFMQELVAGSTQVKLETLTYPAGWYLVELSGAGQLVQRKLVVRH